MCTVRNLLAIDPSLTCSGWALFSIHSDKLLAIGKIKSLPPKLALPDRLSDLQSKIGSLLTKLSCNERDLMVTEAPTTMRDPRAAIKVEQVRGMFETLARQRSLTVPGRLNPRTVHHEVFGLRGKQVPRAEIKEMAVQVVNRLFAQSLKSLGFDDGVEHLRQHQDIVDAILIGYVAMSRVKTALHAGSDDFAEMFVSRATGSRLARR